MNQAEALRTCKECNWWKSTGDSGSGNGAEQGRCHGRAPTVTAVVMPVVHQISGEVTPQILEVTVWPVTGASCEGCGDFRIKPPVPDGLVNKETKGRGDLNG